MLIAILFSILFLLYNIYIFYGFFYIFPEIEKNIEKNKIKSGEFPDSNIIENYFCICGNSFDIEAIEMVRMDNNKKPFVMFILGRCPRCKKYLGLPLRDFYKFIEELGEEKSFRIFKDIEEKSLPKEFLKRELEGYKHEKRLGKITYQ